MHIQSNLIKFTLGEKQTFNGRYHAKHFGEKGKVAGSGSSAWSGNGHIRTQASQGLFLKGKQNQKVEIKLDYHVIMEKGHGGY